MSTVSDASLLSLDDLDRSELLFVLRRAIRISPEHMAVLVKPADLFDARADREARMVMSAISRHAAATHAWSTTFDALQSCRAIASRKDKQRAAEDAYDAARMRCERAWRAYLRHIEAEKVARDRAERLRGAVPR